MSQADVTVGQSITLLGHQSPQRPLVHVNGQGSLT